MKDFASENPTQFSIRQTTALHALASGFSVTEAAETAGVHRSQVYRWLDNPKYNNAFLNAKREHALAIGYRFHTLAHKALDALEQILSDEKANPHAKIRAAKLVFEKMHQHQPRLKPSWDEMVQIDDQCRDAKAPHIVVGRFPYDPEACGYDNQSPQAIESIGATECDAKSEFTKGATASATECDTKEVLPNPASATSEASATECDSNEQSPQQAPSATRAMSTHAEPSMEAVATLCDAFTEAVVNALNRSGGAGSSSASRNE